MCDSPYCLSLSISTSLTHKNQWPIVGDNFFPPKWGRKRDYSRPRTILMHFPSLYSWVIPSLQYRPEDTYASLRHYLIIGNTTRMTALTFLQDRHSGNAIQQF